MGDDAIAMYDGADTVVLYEELAFQDEDLFRLPVCQPPS